MKNPLASPILAILKDHPTGIGEFDILKKLQQQMPEFGKISDDPNLLLFRQHFLIMNALYQLQSNLWEEENLLLNICSTQVTLFKAHQIESSGSTVLSDSCDAKLAAYYLDWDEYEKTGTEEVSRLLNSFYKGMSLNGDRDSALKKLQIKSKNPSKSDIKQQYRKLAQHHHPDHGGDKDAFIDLRQAYEYLMF